MTDDRETKLRKMDKKGMQAKDLIDNELLNEAFEFIEEKIISEWKEGDARDELHMKKCKDRLDSIRLVRMYLKEVLVKGKNARKELLELQKTTPLRRVFSR